MRDLYIICYIHTVNFHNFKSQNLKLRVSNPKNIYVAYLSVLSQISNCQGLGRKSKHEILKTDRISLSIHHYVIYCLFIVMYCIVTVIHCIIIH